MKKVVKVFRYNRFSPLRNKMIPYREVKCERPLTIAERKIVRRNIVSNILCLILPLIAIASGGAFTALAMEISPWFWFGLVATALCVVGTFFVMGEYDATGDLIAHFEDWGFEIEQLKWEQFYDEQMHNMTVWRKQHPLEEAVRKAQESQNCIDIVEAARLYAEQYFKGVL